MPNKFGLTQIDHITLIVSDLDATRSFYCDVLGMFEVPRPQFEFPGLWLDSDQPQPGQIDRALIHATLSNEQSGRAGWGDQGATRASRGHHFAFQVKDAAAMSEAIKNKGVEIVSGPKQRPDGPTQVFVKDPDGHLIEFFSL